jgi:hypothetical protein
MIRGAGCAAAARRALAVGAAAALAALLLPMPAAAQPYIGSAAPHGGSIEIGGGVVWLGGYDTGDPSATETSNSSTGGAPLTLFATTSRVAPATGVDARAAVYLSSRAAVEGLFQFARPELRVRITSDFENAADTTAVGRTSSYVFGGSLVYHFSTGRIVPFVIGGGAYLRQLDEDNAAVLTGNEVHAGGGVKVWFGTGPRALGLRLDAQASSRSRSAGFEEKRRLLPTLSAGLSYRF